MLFSVSRQLVCSRLSRTFPMARDHGEHTSPMMLTLPGLLDTKSGLLPYVSWNVFNSRFHLAVCVSNASSGYMPGNALAVGTSIASNALLFGYRRRDWNLTKRRENIGDLCADDG
nr:hypothetical protein CFP56_63035 [Quercus suber]